ncbi:MAG TPA: prepilin-type N-terminal cleavage/methylation domain-containing protein [Mollicutes bacterium]|nr:prepilin-type N-terminal cleavage/methylation domain-containing protein [Mollicutes bacterium]
MIRNKKGFTLVELLAVIVILAIILAIAVPGISNMIDNSKKSAFEADAKMIITGLEYQNLEASLGQATAVTIKDLNADELKKLGANPANYEIVSVVALSPMKLCIETSSNSKFGTQKALITKATVDHNASLNCETYSE